GLAEADQLTDFEDAKEKRERQDRAGEQIEWIGMRFVFSIHRVGDQARWNAPRSQPASAMRAAIRRNETSATAAVAAKAARLPAGRDSRTEDQKSLHIDSTA